MDIKYLLQRELQNTIISPAFAEILQGKTTLKSQIIDRTMTLTLKVQCKCRDETLQLNSVPKHLSWESDRKQKEKGMELLCYEHNLWIQTDLGDVG